MASVEEQSVSVPPSEPKGIPKSKRKLQKHLRSAGLAYVSRTGKLIPAKKVSGKFSAPKTRAVKTVCENLDSALATGGVSHRDVPDFFAT